MENLSELLSYNVGKTAKIFLLNGFRFEGKIQSVLQDFVQILDFKLGYSKIIRISQISEIEVQE